MCVWVRTNRYYRKYNKWMVLEFEVCALRTWETVIGRDQGSGGWVGDEGLVFWWCVWFVVWRAGDEVGIGLKRDRQSVKRWATTVGKQNIPMSNHLAWRQLTATLCTYYIHINVWYEWYAVMIFIRSFDCNCTFNLFVNVIQFRM